MRRDFTALDIGQHDRKDVYELAEFFDMEPGDVVRRLSEEHHQVLRMWADADPQTDDEKRRWYETTDAHIFEGMAWHGQISQRQFREAIAERCHGRILGYGCGVGTEMVLAAAIGCDVVCVEIGLMKRFVEFRLGKVPDAVYKVITPEEMGHMGGPFDVIICLDFLEHIGEPEGLLRDFREWLKPDGLFIGSAPFSELQWPGHLEKHKNKLLSRMCKDAGITNYWIDPIRPQWKVGVDT